MSAVKHGFDRTNTSVLRSLTVSISDSRFPFCSSNCFNLSARAFSRCWEVLSSILVLSSFCLSWTFCRFASALLRK